MKLVILLITYLITQLINNFLCNYYQLIIELARNFAISNYKLVTKFADIGVGTRRGILSRSVRVELGLAFPLWCSSFLSSDEPMQSNHACRHRVVAVPLLKLLKGCRIEPAQRCLQDVDVISSTIFVVRPSITGWYLQGLLLFVCYKCQNQFQPGIL